MPTIAELIELLQRGAQRLRAQAMAADRAGGEAERLRGESDAYLLLAQELGECGDPVALLDALFTMERAAAWMAQRDEEQSAEFDAQGNASASRFHAKGARYAHGLVAGYSQARILLGTSLAPDQGPLGPQEEQG